MRITILWSGLAAYTIAFLKELSLLKGIDLQIVYHKDDPLYPYDPFDLSFCLDSHLVQKNRTAELVNYVKIFDPDVILMASWNYSYYMSITKEMRKKGVKVISTIDHQWIGSFKQWGGRLLSRWYLKPYIDNFLVAGDRQAEFARLLGYKDVMYGLYAADVRSHESAIKITDREKTFIYVGRLIERKGIRLLINAYRLYRNLVSNPWNLKIIGEGPLKEIVGKEEGIVYKEFLQPNQLKQEYLNASCFILPSLWEPWGVVIHEAAASSLPIIATYQCGATTYFLRDGNNGYIISPKETSLAQAMSKISGRSDSELEEMSRISSLLANLWTPRKLAKYFVSELVMEIERNEK